MAYGGGCAGEGVLKKLNVFLSQTSFTDKPKVYGFICGFPTLVFNEFVLLLNDFKKNTTPCRLRQLNEIFESQLRRAKSFALLTSHMAMLE